MSLWPQGMHVCKKDWRQGPAFWKLWHSARPFPVTYPTWVDVCRRPSEVGALIPWNLASRILSGLPLADAHRAARVSWWRWRLNPIPFGLQTLYRNSILPRIKALHCPAAHACNSSPESHSSWAYGFHHTVSQILLLGSLH